MSHSALVSRSAPALHSVLVSHSALVSRSAPVSHSVLVSHLAPVSRLAPVSHSALAFRSALAFSVRTMDVALCVRHGHMPADLVDKAAQAFRTVFPWRQRTALVDLPALRRYVRRAQGCRQALRSSHA